MGRSLFASHMILSSVVLLGSVSGGGMAGGEALDSELAILGEWLTGSFSSREQAAADPAFHDVRLSMERIWPERTDGYWLYVEQAIAGHEARPYRQRVYHLTRHSPDSLRSEVYTLPGAERFIGGFAARESSTIIPDSLELRAGCAIFLVRKDAESFTGSTQGPDCASTLRGAAYATSEVVVTEETLASWDRGFDVDGEQVWGSTAGPYIFRKETR
jgi:hypothetical protein